MKVSVVLPCYNAERFLGRCLEGLFTQTHRDLDIIAVNDGSTDGTLALLGSAAARSPFPFRIIDQVNAGACAARNAGLKHASGTYVQFMDADDTLLPPKLAHQVTLAEREGLPDLIVGSAHTYRPDGSLRDTDIQSPDDRDPWFDLMRHRLGGTPMNLWKRSALESVGGWNVAMTSSQEYELMFRLLKNGAHLVFDPDVLTEVHLQHGSVSTGKLDRTWSRFIELRILILAHIEQEHPNIDPTPYRQVLFDSIRTLYPYAPTRSVELYERHLPGFVPTRSAATGQLYLVLHRALGYRLANRVRWMFSATPASAGS